MVVSGDTNYNAVNRRLFPGSWHLSSRPVWLSRSSYARRFQDPWFGQPYVDEVLSRHNLPSGLARLGTGGTFPTFLVGAYVIKFFGAAF